MATKAKQIKKAVSFVHDIRPLFRDFDIQQMIAKRNLDLANYDEVKSLADRILNRIELGEMPCDAPWPQEWVELFRKWIADGKLP